MDKAPVGSLDINWQEAVARLARERALAETGVRILKQHGSSADIESGSLAYGEAKAEYDAIIAGLIVALAQKAAPSSLSDLEARLRSGLQKREAFYRNARRVLPKSGAGERGWVKEAVTGVLEPLLDAIKAIWLRSRDDDDAMRKTIQTQLEATIWLDFAAVSASA